MKLNNISEQIVNAFDAPLSEVRFSTDSLFSGCADINNIKMDALSQKMTYIDLFAGAGGLSEGFKMAGYEGIAAVEYNPNASATYKLNFEHEIITGDITKDEVIEELILKARQKLQGRELDVLCAGFPCQSFSTAGKRKLDDPRNSLYQYVVKVAEILRPKYIVGENVPGLLTKKFKNGKKCPVQIILDFQNIGYQMDFRIIHAEDYGVAEKRDRVFFVGTRMDNQILFPLPLFYYGNFKTVRDAIMDLADSPEDEAFNHTFVKSEHETLAKFALMKEGDRISEKRNDSCGRLFLDQPAWTMKHNNGHPAIHPTLDRIISPREMARIQSFPDDFIFASCRTQQYKQIGNAVPPLMARAVALSVMEMENRRVGTVGLAI